MINRLQVLQKSFSARIFLTLILTMVCMAVLFDFIFISMQKKNYQIIHGAHATTTVRMFAHTIRLAVFIEDIEEMLAPVEGLLRQDDVIEVVIWNKEGKALLQKTKKPAGKMYIKTDSMDLQMVLDYLERSSQLNRETQDSFVYWSQVYFDESPTTEENLYFDEEKNDATRDVVGYVTVVLTKKQFNQDVLNILIQTGASVLIFLCIGIVVTFIIIRKLTQPLRKLMLIARKDGGDTKEPDDLALLTETYESMIDDLENSLATISALNDGLEGQVAHRTLELTEANEELSQKQEKLEDSYKNLTQTLSRLQDTQEQLIQKEKLAAMGQLVAGVAHEINNTVNFISGALPSLRRSMDEIKKVLNGYEKVEQGLDDGVLNENLAEVRALKEELAYDELFSTIDQLLENIDEGTVRTTRIIRDLNTFSRENAETVSLSNLHSVIDSTLNYIDKKLLKNITLTCDYGSIPHIYCLPGRMSQVFLNIMQNGIQAMDGAGQLTIKTQYINERVHLSFSDTGCGIASQDKSKIFDPFFTKKEVGKGVGLGLGISHTIIKQHGGIINVQSEVGQGTVFEIILPVKPVKIPLKGR